MNFDMFDFQDVVNTDKFSRTFCCSCCFPSECLQLPEGVQPEDAEKPDFK